MVMLNRLGVVFFGPREKITTSEDSMLLVVCRMNKGLQENM
jgi:hypothetical protein